ncbi:MAG TPA: phenylacetate--CoA ligase family protein, partial [Solirubrobacteraceae bacterium]|nr:phenylacetate--CoA ligase family protein [Solirubrobacteraceae bacterium]
MISDSPYWNPKTETLAREQLDALQLAKLRRQVAWAADRSPWFKRTLAGFDVDDLRAISDLRRLPMLTRDDWMQSQRENPPYGELPAIGGE